MPGGEREADPKKRRAYVHRKFRFRRLRPGSKGISTGVFNTGGAPRKHEKFNKIKGLRGFLEKIPVVFQRDFR